MVAKSDLGLTMLHDFILINGASSAGKTSIAHALQEVLGTVTLNFSIDSILYALPRSDLARMIAGERIVRKEYDYDRLVRSYHAAAAGLLETGNRLILDNAVTRPEWRLDLEARLAPFRGLWVGVTCDPSVLAEREQARGDRAPGTAIREAAVVHDGFRYDVIVDTSAAPAEDAAREIAAKLVQSRA